MIVYRVVNVKYKVATLSGIGDGKVGGRWNQVGTKAIYGSENISLAWLEYYVHSENITYLPIEILIAKIQFPDEFTIEELKDFPERWNQYPYVSRTTKVFTSLVKKKNLFALRVPSTIVGLESNIILNLFYKDFGKIEEIEFIEFPIDLRLKNDKRG